MSVMKKPINVERQYFATTNVNGLQLYSLVWKMKKDSALIFCCKIYLFSFADAG